MDILLLEIDKVIDYKKNQDVEFSVTGNFYTFVIITRFPQAARWILPGMMECNKMLWISFIYMHLFQSTKFDI